MKFVKYIFGVITIMISIAACTSTNKNQPIATNQKEMTAKMLLGNPNYLAISYGGYRMSTRDVQPSIAELKQDMRILEAMGIKLLRTYNVTLPHASNVLKAIRELKSEDSNFEMYVMLGAWIDCKNAWTDQPVNHQEESEHNADEISRAVALAQQYSDIVKIIAVGNEAMVKWATAYYVEPEIILKWVNHLQDLKTKGTLNPDLWITSSDNFASWGGGETTYHNKDLEALIHAVDFISMHTYPMHDTHYNPVFWGVLEDELELANTNKIEAAMERAVQYAKAQYQSVKAYTERLGIEKPIHIGETGWATKSNGFYGDSGAQATDEYKSGLYYHAMRAWTKEEGMSCFYFQAFDEPWKDAENPEGSENHFGLITVNGKAKYALWELVDKGVFAGMKRGEYSIEKSYNGSLDSLMEDVKTPAMKTEFETYQSH